MFVVAVGLAVLLGGVGIYVMFIYGNYSGEERFELYTEKNAVLRVIDGDTLELGSGEIVRLLCVDTPERSEEGYKEASEFLEGLVLYKKVRLEKGKENRDRYGRLLRYVYVSDNGGEIFVNKEIIDKGYGEVFPFGEEDCADLKN